MRLTKRQSLIVSVGALILFFVAATWLAGKNRTTVPTQNSTPATATIPSTDDGQFILKDFQRSETKDGRKIWEVKAAQGAYNPVGSAITLREATLRVYQKDNTSVELTAEKAVLHMSGTQLTSADVAGSVQVVKDDNIVVTTDQAVYDRDKGTVHAPGFVQLTSPQADISGTGLLVNVETKSLTLAAQVSTVVKPKPTP